MTAQETLIYALIAVSTLLLGICYELWQSRRRLERALAAAEQARRTPLLLPRITEADPPTLTVDTAPGTRLIDLAGARAAREAGISVLVRRADGAVEHALPEILERAPCLPEGWRPVSEPEREGAWRYWSAGPILCLLCAERIPRATVAATPGAVLVHGETGCMAHSACVPGYHLEDETCDRCAGLCFDLHGADPIG